MLLGFDDVATLPPARKFGSTERGKWGAVQVVRWRRGFIRLWISLTVIWLVSYGISAFADQDIGSLTHSCEELRDLVDPITGKKTLSDNDVVSIINASGPDVRFRGADSTDQRNTF
jgi:hypothetical protein